MGALTQEARGQGHLPGQGERRRDHGWNTYGQVLSTPVARRLAMGGLVGRLREGGASVAILLSVRHAGEPLHAAALASGAYLVCAAFSRPVEGKLLGRLGHRRMLSASSVANTAVLSGFACILLAHAREPVVLAFAGSAGLTLPAITVSLRSSWPNAVPKADLVSTAYALDGALYQAAQAAGPALVSLMAAIAAPGSALFVLAFFGMVGTSVVARSTPARPTGTATGRAAPHGTSAGLAPESSQSEGRTYNSATGRWPAALVLLVSLFTGVFQGSLLLVAAAVALGDGNGPASGLLLSCFSLGALAGGLAYGAVSWKVVPSQRALVAGTALAGISFSLHFPAPLPAFAGLVALVGLARAATNTSVLLVVQARFPAAQQASAFAWLSMATKVGESAGAALAGATIAAGGAGAGAWQISAAATAIAVVCLIGQRAWR